MRFVGKLVLYFLAAIVAVVAGFTLLRTFFGLRVELYGSGMKPHFYFYKPEQHYAQLEMNRAEQRAAAAAPAAVPEPVPAAAPATEATPVAAVVSTKMAPPLPKTSEHVYWTNFRGPHRNGIYDETPIKTSWPPDGLKTLWKQPVGGGYASFSVAGGKAFTIEQRRNQEVVAAYDVNTGRELWSTGWPASFQEPLGGDGPRATPTWNDGRVYALGATGELHALDAATGKTVWSHNILTENGAVNLIWGMAASPLVVDDKVIVLPGSISGKSVVAYDKVSGKVVWTSQNDKAGYSSPVEATIDGQRQIIVVSRDRVMGLAIEDGKLLWEFPWFTSPEVNATEPVFIDDHRFFLSSGYDHGAVLLDISRSGDSFTAKQVWFTKRMKTRFNAAVFYKGYIYGLDEGILACLDASTGELKWKGGRYGYGQLLLASGHLIILTEQGELVLVRANPEKLDEVSKFTVLDGKTWNYPAIDNGRLLVRNTTEMAALKID